MNKTLIKFIFKINNIQFDVDYSFNKTKSKITYIYILNRKKENVILKTIKKYNYDCYLNDHRITILHKGYYNFEILNISIKLSKLYPVEDIIIYDFIIKNKITDEIKLSKIIDYSLAYYLSLDDSYFQLRNNIY